MPRPKRDGATSERASVSMADVAQAAGVSAQTVSRVLSGQGTVRESTRARVDAAVRSLGYHPNLAARTLATGRTRRLGIILTGSSTSRVLVEAGAEAATRRLGYRLASAVVDTTGVRSLRRAADQLRSDGAEGIIVAVPVTARDRWTPRGFPVVSLDDATAGSPEFVTDQRAIGRMATEHLLELGHRTVWCVCGPAQWPEAKARVEGWRSALIEARAPVPDVLHGDWTPGEGYRMGALIAGEPSVTGVFAASDELAIGVSHALWDVGRRVPGDVSLVGVDDIPIAAHLRPPLTTVRQPFATLTDAAVRLLIATLDTSTRPHVGNDASDSRSMRPSLVVRSSTAAPPSGVS